MIVVLDMGVSKFLWKMRRFHDAEIVLNENDIGNLHSSKCCCRLERKDGHKCIFALKGDMAAFTRYGILAVYRDIKEQKTEYSAVQLWLN
jgi:hypothetical protein